MGTLDLSRQNQWNEKDLLRPPRQPGGESRIANTRQPVQPEQPEVTAAPPAPPTLSLFDRIKARARGSATSSTTQSPRERAPSLFAEPSRDPESVPRRARPVTRPATYQQSNSRFGVFDEVRLPVPGQQTPRSGAAQVFPAVPRGSSSSGKAQPYGQPQPYGEFQT